MVPVQSKYYKFLENISVYARRRSKGVRERSGGGGGKILQWLTVFVLAFILLRTLQISFQREIK